MAKNKEIYVDPNGKRYTVESMACVAGLGRLTKNIHVLYEDGSKAVFPEDVHLRHSKVEQLVQASSNSTPEPTQLSLLDIHTQRSPK